MDEIIREKPEREEKNIVNDSDSDYDSDDDENKARDDALREKLKRKGYLPVIIDNADSNQLRVYEFESNNT